MTRAWTSQRRRYHGTAAGVRVAVLAESGLRQRLAADGSSRRRAADRASAARPPKTVREADALAPRHAGGSSLTTPASPATHDDDHHDDARGCGSAPTG